MILLPVKDGVTPDWEGYRQIICEVNENQLAVGEILSDHPYFYDRATGQLSAA